MEFDYGDKPFEGFASSFPLPCILCPSRVTSIPPFLPLVLFLSVTPVPIHRVGCFVPLLLLVVMVRAVWYHLLATTGHFRCCNKQAFKFRPDLLVVDDLTTHTHTRLYTPKSLVFPADLPTSAFRSRSGGKKVPSSAPTSSPPSSAENYFDAKASSQRFLLITSVPLMPSSLRAFSSIIALSCITCKGSASLFPNLRLLFTLVSSVPKF